MDSTKIQETITKIGESVTDNKELLKNVAGNLVPSLSNNQSQSTGAQSTVNILNLIFKIIYGICSYISIVILFVIVLISLVNIFIYIDKEVKQKTHLNADKNLYLKDTVDIQLLQYALPTCNEENEPYKIYILENINKSMFIIQTIFVLSICLHIGILISFLLWSMYKGYTFGSNIDEIIPSSYISSIFTYILILIIVIITIQILHGYYKSEFNKQLNDIKEYNTYLTNLKNDIYKLIIPNNKILNVLVIGDNIDIINLFAKMINNLKPNSQINSRSDITLAIVTYSIIDFYQKNIPEIDINYTNVMKIFSYEQISQKKINPIDFFIYKKPTHINSIWALIRDDIKNVVENKYKNTTFFNSDNEDSLVRSIDQSILNINNKLISLNSIPKFKKKLIVYMVGYFFIALLFYIICCILLYYMYRINSLILSGINKIYK